MKRLSRLPSGLRKPLFRLGLLPLVALLLGDPVRAQQSIDGQVLKAPVSTQASAPNLLAREGWRPYEKGFERDGEEFVCDNGPTTESRRGAAQSVKLDQKEPLPIVARVSSLAEGTSGGTDSNYSLYLDLVYQDGTQLWGQSAAFNPAQSGWQQKQVVVLPDKPVKSVSMYLLFRGRSGKARFRDAELHQLTLARGAALFGGVPLVPVGRASEGFQVRDFAAKGGFVRIDKQALGLKLQAESTEEKGAKFIEAELRDTTGKDRAVTLIYAVPVPASRLRWLEPRTEHTIESARPGAAGRLATRKEWKDVGQFHVGSGGLSRYPLAAVADAKQGVALAIDLGRPAYYRLAYNAGTEELYLAYDLGLTPEKPTAKVRFCRFTFDPASGFRGALARYYALFPKSFECRTPQQGLWMPFAPISKVPQWEDFGFKFKEGNDETAWDDAHGIITFRYTEPMTWWMRMPKVMPRTMEAALAEARRLSEQKKDKYAQALWTSGFHDPQGHFPARLLDTPWCNGAVWSMNSMPGVPGEVTHFKVHWNQALIESLYGAQRKADLDGEYIDSSEGYVTDELNYRRDHFAAADTPLTFDPDTAQPAIFRGLIAFEYVRGIADDMHRRGKLMMANGAPTRLPWLVPLIEVAGTETDWHRQGKWRPMSDGEMIYRRIMCKGKPYCFLMNTVFEEFPPELVEKYMKRSLAYGMFPGFFSHNASQGHYFKRPEIYNRDRPLFKRYMPLCKRVAEAGWEPMTHASSSVPQVYVERFGNRLLTVFNDSPEARKATVHLTGMNASSGTDLLTGGSITFTDGRAEVSLAAEDVAVIELDGP